MGTLSSELAPLADRLSPNPRIYADANVPAGLVAYMRDRLRWDVLFVLEKPELRRAPDIKHYQLARRLLRTIVTLDRDYLDDRRFPPEEGAGVLVISAPDERQLLALLDRVNLALFQAPLLASAAMIEQDGPAIPGVPAPPIGADIGGAGTIALERGLDDGRFGLADTGPGSPALPLAGRKLHVHTEWGR